MSFDKENREKRPGLTAQQVLAAVQAKYGRAPNRWRFDRIAALLPQLPSVSSGKPGRPPTLYAPEAVDWVEGIAAIRGFPWRKLPRDLVAFELWWQGVDVDVEDARGYLVKELGRRIGKFGVTRSGSRDPFDVADEIVTELRSKPLRSALVRLLSRRVGRDLNTFIDGIYALIVFFLGGEPAWDDSGTYADIAEAGRPSPAEALVRLFGYDRAASDTAPDGSRLIEGPVDVRAMLSEVRDLTGGDVRKVPDAVADASAAELDQARDDAYVFAEAMPIAAEAFQRAYRRDFAGFGIFTILYRITERYFRIVVTIAMLLIRKRLTGQKIDELNDALRSSRDACQAYISITDSFPQYAKYWRVDHEEQVARLSEDFVTRMHEDLEVFLDSNPEIRNALIPAGS
jgi:hypothetical protein